MCQSLFGIYNNRFFIEELLSLSIVSFFLHKTQEKHNISLVHSLDLICIVIHLYEQRMIFINNSRAPVNFDLLFVVFVSGLYFYFDLYFVSVQQYSSADYIEEVSFDYKLACRCTYQFLANFHQ